MPAAPVSAPLAASPSSGSVDEEQLALPREEYHASVVASFDSLAAASQPGQPEPLADKLAERAISLLRLSRGERVVDLACGEPERRPQGFRPRLQSLTPCPHAGRTYPSYAGLGQVAVAAGQAVGPAGRVLAVDISSRSLELVRPLPASCAAARRSMPASTTASAPAAGPVATWLRPTNTTQQHNTTQHHHHNNNTTQQRAPQQQGLLRPGSGRPTQHNTTTTTTTQHNSERLSSRACCDLAQADQAALAPCLSQAQQRAAAAGLRNFEVSGHTTAAACRHR